MGGKCQSLCRQKQHQGGVQQQQQCCSHVNQQAAEFLPQAAEEARAKHALELQRMQSERNKMQVRCCACQLASAS
jgi:hypothetical protein